jgi:uncharacterized protein (TIGR02118 family)
MIKACTLFKRKKGLGDEEYQKYWRDNHLNVIRRLSNIRRYVQSHPVLTEFLNRKPIYDGMAEVWVDDTGALREIAASEAYKSVVADESVFADRSSMILVITEEKTLVDANLPETTKYIQFQKRKPGVDILGFQKDLMEKWAPLFLKAKGVRRYVQSHTKLSGYKADQEPIWDSIDIFWLESPHAVHELETINGSDLSRKIREDLMRSGPSPGFLTNEHVMIS